ncbi:MAG: cation-translocating P-type ATPase [Planctomycetes bacterium]|nr:cation-translocating P-type ATPase [Planctomycetota bacterium]
MCAKPGRRESATSAYAHFDDEAFTREVVTQGENGVWRATLALKGMRCASCVWAVEELPKRIGGVIETRVDFRRGRVEIAWSPKRTSIGTIASALNAMGYTPAPIGDQGDQAERKALDRAMMVRLAVAGACAGNAMLLGIAMYAGLFDEMEMMHLAVLRWASLVVTLIAMIWLGRVFFISAWQGLRSGTLNLDAPISLALLAGGVWSGYTTIRGHGEVYFDSVSVLIFALLIGRYVQHRQQLWAADSVELLFSLTPGSARRVKGNVRGKTVEVEPVSVLSLTAGDVVEVLVGESVPVDGTVVWGESSVDQAFLTGESKARKVGSGDEVFAGSVNMSGVIRVASIASGRATRVGKLMEMVQEATTRKPEIVKLAHKVGSAFMIGMVLTAVATFAAWSTLGVQRGIEAAVSLLVVTCPCALGLATPLAFTIAIGRAARRGILIKGGDVLQKLAGGGVLLLDKTGTLTTGKMGLVEWHGSDRVLGIVAELEKESTHPVGRALSAYAGFEHGARIAGVSHAPGAGISARVDGLEMRVGSGAFCLTEAVSRFESFKEMAARGSAVGLTPVFVVHGTEVVACALVGDERRADAFTTVAGLMERGWECRVVSGDDAAVVAHVASECGIQKHEGECTPEGKLKIVREQQAANQESGGESRAVVMVGDGVNDAVALAAADVGIAVAGGAQASLAAADVYVSRPGLSPLLELMEASKRTMLVVRLALLSSIVYNVTAGTLAVTGHVSPIIAALVMPVSSITAIGICMIVPTFPKKSARTQTSSGGES